jgi:hypothetical protein
VWGPGSQSWREGSVFLGDIASNILAVIDGIASLAIVFLVAKITRSKVAAMAVVALVAIGVNLLGENIRVELVIASAAVILWLICLMRVGLLSVCVSRCVFYTLGGGVVTSDFSRWYAWRGLTELAVVSAIALYGFKVALGRKPLFGAALED